MVPKTLKDKHKGSPFWLPLDNAAKIFPAIRSKEHTTVIRCTAVLRERIAIKPLMEAVSLAGSRFPYFRVGLHRGVFWYYLEESPNPFSLVPDTGGPARPFTRNGNEHLVRILVYKNRLTVEASHILTDGYGVSRLLIWILEKYFERKDSGAFNDHDVVPDEALIQAETEDAYSKYFKQKIPFAARLSKAFHVPYKLNRKPRFDVLVALMKLSEIKEKASEKGVSITEYLIAVQMYVLQEIANKVSSRQKKVIRIQVPVNLRNTYPSKTMRNFSLFVMPEIDPRLGKYTFEEIVKIVHYKMQLETDEKLISKIIARNVGSEKKLLVRGIPLVIKNLVLRYKYYTEGANQYSGVVTNLGRITLSEQVQDKIDYFVFTPPPPNKKLKINCGIAGFDDKLTLSFGNITNSKEMERRFIRFLTREGIRIQLKKITDL